MTTAGMPGVTTESVTASMESINHRKEAQSEYSFQQSLLEAKDNLANNQVNQAITTNVSNGQPLLEGVYQAPLSTRQTTTNAIAARNYSAGQSVASLRSTATYRSSSFSRNFANSLIGSYGNASTSRQSSATQAIVSTALDRLRQRSSAIIKKGSNSTGQTNSVASTTKTSNVNGVNGARPSGVMALSDYPRPVADNGRGMHWVPTVHSDTATVDKYVQEMSDMHVKWAVVLNEDCKTGDNDYLVKKLVANGIMPVMRVYTPDGAPIQGDLKALVQHYKALGVEYYQLYNEPNLNAENQGQTPDPKRYVDMWLPAAKAVTEAGGLPGFGSLAPGGNYDDIEFFKQSLAEVKARGETKALDHAWVGIHNYTLNHPLDYTKDSNGFLKFRWYDQIVNQTLGHSLPIVGTEGGTFVGVDCDKDMPAISEKDQINMVTGAFQYMKNAEPYYLAYTYWNVANQAGGGADLGFENQALFRKSGSSPVVAALKGMSADPRPNLTGSYSSAQQTTAGTQTAKTTASPSTSIPTKAKATAAVTATQSTSPTIKTSPSSFGQRVVNEAMKYLGKDYVWGGESPDPGFDCTGFTWYVMKQLGRQFPLHDLEGQSATGKQVNKADLQPGDLVFFQNTYQAGMSHVGIYAGDGKFIHAASEKYGVIESRLDDSYWSSRYLSATRPS